MAELTPKKRDKLADKKFGLPDERAYPVHDKAHARNAKARASQQLSKGNITADEKKQIDRKANKVLKGKGK